MDGESVMPDDVVSAGGFDAPEVNAFGHTFRFTFGKTVFISVWH